MEHCGQHRFENPIGSLTWVDRKNGHWIAYFAHSAKTSDPARTQVVQFDSQWKALQKWSFPAKLIEHFAGYSSSGGAFGSGDFLFATGPDARELFVLSLPLKGGDLVWQATISFNTAGQTFAWNPNSAGQLCSIERRSREVLVAKIGRRL